MPQRSSAGTLLPAVAALVPLLVAVPVFFTIGRYFVALLGLHDPYVGDYSGTDLDAMAVFLGHPLYQDPNVGYSGLPYTPLFPLVWGGLDHLFFWRGWGLLLVLLSEVGLLGLIAGLAYRPRDRSTAERILAGLAAIGVAGLGFWLVEFVPFNFLFSPRVDNPAWALAFAGLVLMPWAAAGPRRIAVAAMLLLSAAFWTKHSALFAPLAAAVWLGLAAAAGRTSLRRAAGFAIALAVVNGGLFAIWMAATDGWIGTLLAMAGHHALSVSAARSFGDLLEAVGAALVLLGVLAGSLLLTTVRSRGELRERLRASARWPASWRGQLVLLLLIFLALDAVPSVLFRRAEGAVHNQFLGLAWGLVLLIAIAYGATRRRPATSAVAAVGVLALFGVSESTRLQNTARKRLSVNVPEKSAHPRLTNRPAALVAYAGRHSVYHPVFSDLNARNRGELYPNHDNITQLLASGYQPGYMVDALLRRHFDAVYAFADSPQREVAAGTGKWEDNYVWKLNEVIRAKYRPAVGASSALRRASRVIAYFPYRSPGLYERRPGTDPAPWMRHCFAPFEIAGISWRITRGGGFWCRPGGRGPVLRLVRTPSFESEVRSGAEASSLGGSLGVELPAARGRFSIDFAGFRIDGERDGHRLRVLVGNEFGIQARGVVAGDRVGLRLRPVRGPAGGLEHVTDDPAALLIRVPRAFTSADVGLTASAGSGAAFDLGGLRLGGAQ